MTARADGSGDGGSAAPSEEELLARAYLSRVAEPGELRLWRLVRHVGAAEAARALRAGRVDDDLLAITAVRRTGTDPEADLAAAERHGIRLVVPESSEWPHFAFSALDRAAARLDNRLASGPGRARRTLSGDPVPPLALWVQGNGVELATLGMRAAGLVGSRSATAYGEHVTAEIGYGLASRDVAVVSGGAYGIDAAAHRAALAAQGPTVLVSAGGLDRPYPAANTALYERIAAAGLVISESPPGCAPHRLRFLTRNRLIAALSSGVVVVEAAARSGAINTAGHARALGRPLMAVPGPVTSAMSAGCHALLRDDVEPALLVTSAADVLAVVGSAGEGLETTATNAATAAPDLRAELDGLDPVSRRVFEGLPARRFAAPDEIAVRSGVGPLDVVRVVPALDLAGLIEHSGGRYRISARARTGRAPGARAAP
jgi:DNA processing protein